MNVITYNMQGASHSTENKWNFGVMPLMRSMDPTPVVCLQECGSVPASAIHLDTIEFPLADGTVDRVEVYMWGGSDTRLGYFIFFHNWDVDGNRVNTAIVTDTPPENFRTSVALISPAGGAVWRPALGILFGDTWVFAFHAISPGGPDGAGLLTAVAGNYPIWIVAADWNREPATLAVPPGSVTCPPNDNTYSVQYPRYKYDYCVRSGVDAVTGAIVNTIIVSDHFPVQFAF